MNVDLILFHSDFLMSAKGEDLKMKSQYYSVRIERINSISVTVIISAEFRPSNMSGVEIGFFFILWFVSFLSLLYINDLFFQNLL